MKQGKAFEIFVKTILVNVGFSEVQSDGLYIYDGIPGQMIQGLGEAHNADVLLEPPVQTPFFSRTRLLIECKDYKEKIGMGIVRGVLGLRTDINHFDIVDKNELQERKKQRRKGIIRTYERFSYQVAIGALNGFTTQAQNFAATHRIPLIEFDKMPFWEEFIDGVERMSKKENIDDSEIESYIIEMANRIGKRMAIAITNSGQILFLYREFLTDDYFAEEFILRWVSPQLPWRLVSGGQSYLFQLPDSILKQWLENVSNDFEMKKAAIECKENIFANMVVYYKKEGRPQIKMISINREDLEAVKNRK